MHAQARGAPHDRHVGQQAGTGGGDQGKTGRAGLIAELDARGKAEMAQLPGHHPARRPQSGQVTAERLAQCSLQVGAAAIGEGIGRVHLEGIEDGGGRAIQHARAVDAIALAVQGHHDGGEQAVAVRRMHEHFHAAACQASCSGRSRMKPSSGITANWRSMVASS
ncbi:hypothetical protein G6F24_016547 [Rhizopus arrhizus]|nr:hypothetical protein G6F24_016547 [Rhizopus arrhizus]